MYTALALTNSNSSSHPNQPPDHAHEATAAKSPDATITPIISTPRLADFASSVGRERGTPLPPRLGSSAKTGSPGNHPKDQQHRQSQQT